MRGHQHFFNRQEEEEEGLNVEVLSVQDNNKDLCAVIGRHCRPMLRADPHRTVTVLSRVSASQQAGASRHSCPANVLREQSGNIKLYRC